MIVAQNPLKMGYITGKFSFESGSTPLAYGGSFLADDIVMWSGSSYVPKQRIQKRVTGANQVSTSTSYADVGNLVVPINRPGFYTFEYLILYETSAVGEGIGLQMAFTGTVIGVDYAIDMFTDPATRVPLVTANAFASGVAPQTAGPGAVAALAYVSGSCNVITVGDLSLQFCAETGGANSATVRVGSWGRVNAQ